jgi:hypothetical protein
MPGTPLVFPLASELDGKVQFGPDVLCEFVGFEAGSIVLKSVKTDIGLGHNVTVGHKIVRIPRNCPAKSKEAQSFDSVLPESLLDQVYVSRVIFGQ